MIIFYPIQGLRRDETYRIFPAMNRRKVSTIRLSCGFKDESLAIEDLLKIGVVGAVFSMECNYQQIWQYKTTQKTGPTCFWYFDFVYFFFQCGWRNWNLTSPVIGSTFLLSRLMLLLNKRVFLLGKK